MSAAEVHKRTQSVDAPERRYQLISMASIKLFAESKGYVVNDDVVRMLSEDVNYRVRELVSEATQYQKHSHRSKLTVRDIKHALDDANVRHVTSGQEHVDGKSNQYVNFPELNIHAIKDTVVGLKDIVAKKDSSKEWLNTKTHIAPPSRPLMECLSRYFTEITEALVSSDTQLRQLALADLICNARVSYIKEQLLMFAEKWCETSQAANKPVRAALEVVDAFTNNTSVQFNSQPVLSHLVRILFDKVLLHTSLNNLREAQLSDQSYAALILVKCTRGQANTHVRSSIITRCVAAIEDPETAVSMLLPTLILLSKIEPKRLMSCVSDSRVKSWLQNTKYPDAAKIILQFVIRDGLMDCLTLAVTAEESLALIGWVRDVLDLCPQLNTASELNLHPDRKPSNAQISVWLRRRRLRRSHQGRIVRNHVPMKAADVFTPPVKATRKSNVVINYGVSKPIKSSGKSQHTSSDLAVPSHYTVPSGSAIKLYSAVQLKRWQAIPLCKDIACGTVTQYRSIVL